MATEMLYIRDDDEEKRLKTDLQTIIENEVRIFLIGQSGAGKSETGNTLLGKKNFQPGLSPLPVTSQLRFGTKNTGSRNIIIADGPGLFFDSNFTEENMKKELAKATALLAPGPNVFLLVVGLKKFDGSELKAIEMYKKAFGKDLMKYLIVVFTRGDELERNSLLIQDYVRKFEDVKARSFLASCENRYCSINNVGTADIKKRDANNLLDMIFALENRNERKIYQNAQFIRAEKEIDKRIKEMVNKSPKSLTYDDLITIRASVRHDIIIEAGWVETLIGSLIVGFGAVVAFYIGGPAAVLASAAIIGGVGKYAEG
ncbi:GTPase IMAP family member 3-like [Mytilus edulis]|uniref:GTPase IMAP family member 3-like n=1 Tax=Mytilus edulis TaxID=6550 RepID=UPI0039F0F8A0